MAAITKNRNFFKRPKLLYFKIGKISKFIKNPVIYVKKAHHYAYTVQIWALSGLK
jgi:hypothetical protein